MSSSRIPHLSLPLPYRTTAPVIATRVGRSGSIEIRAALKHGWREDVENGRIKFEHHGLVHTWPLVVICTFSAHERKSKVKYNII